MFDIMLVVWYNVCGWNLERRIERNDTLIKTTSCYQHHNRAELPGIQQLYTAASITRHIRQPRSATQMEWRDRKQHLEIIIRSPCLLNCSNAELLHNLFARTMEVITMFTVVLVPADGSRVKIGPTCIREMDACATLIWLHSAPRGTDLYR